MWDFPVPQGPAMRIATFSATKRQVAEGQRFERCHLLEVGPEACSKPVPALMALE